MIYEPAKAYFLSVWRGQRSMAVTFWLWYVLVVVILIFFGGAVLANVIADMFKTDEPYIWYLAAIFIGTIWVNIGLWRSAARTGGVWSVLARILVAIVLLGVVAQLAWIIVSIAGLT